MKGVHEEESILILLRSSIRCCFHLREPYPSSDHSMSRCFCEESPGPLRPLTITLFCYDS